MPSSTRLAFGTITILFSFATSLATASTSTPMQYSKAGIVISGNARPSTQFEVLASYAPASKEDVCRFPEDQYGMNGAEKMGSVKFKASAQGQFAISLPTRALRGNCPYVLENAYLTIKDKKAETTIALQSANSVKKSEALAQEGDLELNPVPFRELRNLYCDFNSEYETGLCETSEGMSSFAYEVSSDEAVYKLNINDIKSKPSFFAD